MLLDPIWVVLRTQNSFLPEEENEIVTPFSHPIFSFLLFDMALLLQERVTIEYLANRAIDSSFMYFVFLNSYGVLSIV